MESTSQQRQSENKTSNDVRQGFKILLKDYREKTKEFAMLESKLREHKVVVETLMNENSDRKCYLKIDGYLCERKMKDVLPDLINKTADLESRLNNIKDYLANQGDIIQEYRAKHNMELSTFSLYNKLF
ncbi:Probable prefoldin subunit 2 [Gryllus bimaculatus]|nr:Probable prefoldin subunit 2 [Gryllus bimaculatus]